jgi:uncharacterized membrane protein
MFKDTVITAHQKKKEAWVLIACFAGAFIFNIVGIIKFQSPAKELITQLHIVLVLTVFFYVLTGIFRLIYTLVRRVL